MGLCLDLVGLSVGAAASQKKIQDRYMGEDTDSPSRNVPFGKLFPNYVYMP